MKNYIIPLTLYILYGGNKNKSFNNDMKTLFFHPPPLSLLPLHSIIQVQKTLFLFKSTLYIISISRGPEREREKALERKWKK